MNKAFYCALTLLALASCKKENMAVYKNDAKKNETLKTTAACTTPPTFMGIRFAGGPEGSAGIRVIPDANGATFYGSFQGTIDFNPGNGLANLTAPLPYGYFAQRFNKAGHFTGASVVDAAATRDPNWPDRNGNIYLTMFGTDIIDGNTIVPVHLIRQNAAGVQTAKIFLDSTKFDNIFSGNTFVDHNRNVLYVTCAKRLYKFNHQGKLLWKRDIDTRVSTANVMCDKKGDVYVRIYFGLIKYDSNGNLLWTKNINAASKAMTFDAADNIYLTGSFGYEVDFDPGPGTYNLTGKEYMVINLNSVTDSFIVKLDPAGNFVWAVKPGPITPVSLTIDPGGQYVYLSGAVRRTLPFYPLTGEVIYTAKGDVDAAVLVYKQCK